MTEHRDMTRVRRAVKGATIGVMEGHRARRKQHAELAASDLLQVAQVRIEGSCGATPVTVDFKVVWELPFLMRVAPTRTNFRQDRPHFNVGVEMLSNAPVMIDGQVRDWVIGDDEFVTAAKCRVLAFVPGATRKHRFSALVHMTFFGYGAPVEDDPE